jgi:hypothetical protein
LQELDLTGVGVCGTLPHTWGPGEVQDLDFFSNDITGNLPASYGGLSSLKALDVSCNLLTGTMPSAWGKRRLMPQNLSCYFASRVSAGTGINSSIPASWSHFNSGQLTVNPGQLHGCIPGGIKIYILCGDRRIKKFLTTCRQVP